MSNANRMTAPPEVYQQRRAKLAARLTRPLAIFSGHAPARNYVSNPHRFRPGSSYTYFGGPPLENAAWLIEPQSDGRAGCTLFRPPAGPDDALWFGELPSDATLASAAGLETKALAAPDRLPAVLAGRKAAAVIPPYPDTIAWAEQLGVESATEDELRAIVDLRNIKDEHELAAMRFAGTVAMEAHRAARAAALPGRREADAAAAFRQVCTKHQCDMSFNPIITVRGEVLHGHGHPNPLTEGALLLCDAGVEEPGGYASDITRTFPIGSRWTPIQKHLYETVEHALNACVAACRPGVRFRDVHDLSARIVCEGLVAAELLKGKPEELAARLAHTLFYPHGVGHLIGLDVHDMEDFGDVAGYAPGRARRPEFGNKFLRLDRDLTPGLCVTIEPGIYLVPAIWACDELVRPLADVVHRANVDALLKANFGGIRIEHYICVREAAAGGPEVFSAALPTAAE